MIPASVRLGEVSILEFVPLKGNVRLALAFAGGCLIVERVLKGIGPRGEGIAELRAGAEQIGWKLGHQMHDEAAGGNISI